MSVEIMIQDQGKLLISGLGTLQYLARDPGEWMDQHIDLLRDNRSDSVTHLLKV